MLRKLIKTTLILTCSTSIGRAQELTFQKVQGPWVSSKPYLQEKKPEYPEFKIDLLQEFKRIAVDSLNNRDQATAIAKMQSETGTRSQAFGEGFLTTKFSERNATAEGTRETRWTIFRNMRTYAGKEVRLDVVPESLKSGFRFDFSQKSKAPQGPAPVPVRYGLILRDIEPSEASYGVAALNSDYELAQQAPRARLHYEVGPLPPSDEYVPAYRVSLEEQKAAERKWTSYLPDYHFKGKISSRGRPTLAQPIPSQALTLEQADGLYATEIVFVNGLHKESVLHRFYLPIYDRTRISEEYDEQFRPRKVVFNDLLYKGGFSFNLEHYLLEQRYQGIFVYQAGRTRLAVQTHIPHLALENDNFWSKHRWELALDSAF